MPSSKAKRLSSLIRSVVKTSSSAEDVTLKQHISSLDTSPSPVIINKSLIKSPKTPSRPKNTSSKPLSELAVESLKLNNSTSLSEDSAKLSREISAILCGSTALDLVNSRNSQVTDDEKIFEKVLDVAWFPSTANSNMSFRRKEISRERKKKWIFKRTQTNRFDRLVRMCGQKLGSDATIQVFGKLGRETGVKEYNALIRLCIEKARTTEDEEVSLQQICMVYQLFKSMREQGFQVGEETYGPCLVYLIDMGMVHEFDFFCGVIRDDEPKSLSRLAYYEMLLWIRVNNEDKIQELCDIATNDGGDKTNFQDIGAESISNFIYNYAISVPNLAVEDIILKFKNLHAELEVTPSSVPYEKLIRHCCDSLKVHMALDIVDQMFEAGLTLSIETFHSILDACEESCDYNLVRRIYSVICRHNLTPNNETFRSMINLRVKMKDFDGAYDMINDLKKMNLLPTASMYNAIMAGYFREKNIYDGLLVLREMEDADVKPDTQTFCCLIGNCNCEEDIIKYYEELKNSGVQVTKHVFMALINAYVACGQFEKAKQVVLARGVPVKSLNEIKSVLVSALASHGQMSDALNIYEEIKKAEWNLDPRAIISLIEHLQYKGELSRLLQLLEELNSDYWVDGCFRIILYCVRHEHLSSAVDLLKQLKDKFCNDEVAMEALFDEVFCDIADKETTSLQIGLDLLQAIKEELGVRPSRRSLDFLLSACVNAKDLHNSFLIWKEYLKAGLPYNVLSFVRMYQALLASGDQESAKNMLNKIPEDDPHVRCVIRACQVAYIKPTSVKGKKKKKKKKKKEMENSEDFT